MKDGANTTPCPACKGKGHVPKAKAGWSFAPVVDNGEYGAQVTIPLAKRKKRAAAKKKVKAKPKAKKKATRRK